MNRGLKIQHRYEKEFEGVNDVFELQRNLNNCFAYDLVPSPSVCTAALRAARRVNDFPTAVRIFEGTPSICSTDSTMDRKLLVPRTGSANKLRSHKSQSRKQRSILRISKRSRTSSTRVGSRLEGRFISGAMVHRRCQQRLKISNIKYVRGAHAP